MKGGEGLLSGRSNGVGLSVGPPQVGGGKKRGRKGSKRHGYFKGSKTSKRGVRKIGRSFKRTFRRRR